MRPVAHSVNDRVSDAWFSNEPPRHPAHLFACPLCGAPKGAPCTNTIGTLDAGVVGAPIRGLHADRVRASEVAA